MTPKSDAIVHITTFMDIKDYEDFCKTMARAKVRFSENFMAKEIEKMLEERESDFLDKIIDFLKNHYEYDLEAYKNLRTTYDEKKSHSVGVRLEFHYRYKKIITNIAKTFIISIPSALYILIRYYMVTKKPSTDTISDKWRDYIISTSKELMKRHTYRNMLYEYPTSKQVFCVINGTYKLFRKERDPFRVCLDTDTWRLKVLNTHYILSMKLVKNIIKFKVDIDKSPISLDDYIKEYIEAYEDSSKFHGFSLKKMMEATEMYDRVRFKSIDLIENKDIWFLPDICNTNILGNVYAQKLLKFNIDQEVYDKLCEVADDNDVRHRSILTVIISYWLMGQINQAIRQAKKDRLIQRRHRRWE